MTSEQFSLKKFNVLEDNEYYYVFRALNRGDHQDIQNGITSKDGTVERIRTDRERYLEQESTAKYHEDDTISLEEVWDHIKMRYSHETNCISLSTNANVSLDYGNHYFDEYAIVKIPKDQASSFYPAGEYMLSEIDDRIHETIQNQEVPMDISILLNRISTETDNQHVLKIVSDFQKENGNPKNIMSRFQNRQYFTDEQQLEYNKIVAKATILELSGILPSILTTTPNNTSLFATIGNAFSSGEVIHYQEIPNQDFLMISKEMMQLLGIVQQLKEKNHNEDVDMLQSKLLNLIRHHYDFKDVDGKIVLTNGKDTIDCGISTSQAVIGQDYDISSDTMSLHDIYNVTTGCIPYEEANKIVHFCHYLSLSKLESYDYANVVRALLGNEHLTDAIINHTYSPHSDIISRASGSGKQICESVNVGIDYEANGFIDESETNYLLDMISNQSRADLKNAVQSKGLFYRDTLLDRFQKVAIVMDQKSYYAQTVLQDLNHSNAFSKFYEKRNLSQEEYAQLMKDLSDANIIRLYDAFQKQNVSSDDIAGIVVNLLLEGSYEGYSFQDICNMDQVEQFVADHLDKFNVQINPYLFNHYFGIDEDVNLIPNSFLNLYDYQMRIKQTIDQLYADGRRFAGVVLPTGGGKSFVAMAEMLEFKDSNIVYIAPRKEILKQFKRNIVQYIAGKNPKNYSEEEINHIVSFCFPHLELYCYQGLSPDDEDRLKKYDADFVILDEIHHIGGDSWNPAIRALFTRNGKSKVLGISATPIRDDVKKDDPYFGDMMRFMADFLDNYSIEELNSHVYLASEMSVVEAAQEGYVICPNIVSFDYDLADTPQYQSVLRTAATLKDISLRNKANESLDELQRLINRSKLVGVNAILEKYIQNPTGRYIYFIPRKPVDCDLSTEAYIKEHINQMKEDLKGIDVEPHFEYIYSARGDKENTRAMQQFEDDNSDHMKILVAIDMLNEGVHLPNLSGSFNFRKIDSKHSILAQQHLGRVIHAVNPNHSEEEIPVVFDKFNNYFNMDIDRMFNRTSVSSDLQKMRDIMFGIQKYGRIPSVDGTPFERRKAYSLKRIQKKYQGFLDGSLVEKNLSSREKKELHDILSFGRDIDLWNHDFGTGSARDEENYDQVHIFQPTATQRSFLELCREIQNLSDVSSQTKYDRINQLLVVLDFLSEYHYDISPRILREGVVLEDVLNTIDNYGIRSKIIEELNVRNILPTYPIGSEYRMTRDEFAKEEGLFNTKQRSWSIQELFHRGLLENDEIYQFLDSRGFLVTGPKNLIGVNALTGTFYGEDGYDVNGFDIHHFNSKGIHANTLTKYNEFGFDCQGIHKDTHTQYDLHNFTIDGFYLNTDKKTDPYGFSQDGLINGSKKYTVDGYNIDGYNKRGFDRKGIHGITQKPYDLNYFGSDGHFWELQGTERVRTDRTYNDEDVTFDGYFLVRGANGQIIRRNLYDKRGFSFGGIHKDTGQVYDLRGFDRDGFWYRKDENGNIVKTNQKVNDRGWDAYSRTIRHDVYGAPFWDFVDDHGFDEKKRYHAPKAPFENGCFTKMQFGTLEYAKTPMSQYRCGYDIHGFNADGVHRITGTKVDLNGFDQDGFWHRKREDGTYENTGQYFDNKGWTIDKFKLLPSGYSKVDERGFDANGMFLYHGRKFEYNSLGFNSHGIHQSTGTNLDPDSFDWDGYYYKLDDKTGTYVNSGSKYDNDGWSQTGVNEETKHVVDKHGFTVRHLYRKPDASLEVYDRYGFDYYGIHRTTGTFLNRNHFNRDGDYYVLKTTPRGEKTWVNTGSKYDSEGYNIDRLDQRGFSKNGYYHGRQNRYDENGFDVNGIHRLTLQAYDLNGNDCYGNPVDHDRDLIVSIRDGVSYDKRRYIDDIFNDLNGTEQEFILSAVDLFDDTVDMTNDSLLDFIAYVKKYGVQSNDKICGTQDTIEFVKDRAYEQEEEKRFTQACDALQRYHHDDTYSEDILGYQDATDTSDFDYLLPKRR